MKNNCRNLKAHFNISKNLPLIFLPLMCPHSIMVPLVTTSTPSPAPITNRFGIVQGFPNVRAEHGEERASSYTDRVCWTGGLALLASPLSWLPVSKPRSWTSLLSAKFILRERLKRYYSLWFSWKYFQSHQSVRNSFLELIWEKNLALGIRTSLCVCYRCSDLQISAVQLGTDSFKLL